MGLYIVRAFLLVKLERGSIFDPQRGTFSQMSSQIYLMKNELSLKIWNFLQITLRLGDWTGELAESDVSASWYLHLVNHHESVQL
jgi:hypothetical protein